MTILIAAADANGLAAAADSWTLGPDGGVENVDQVKVMSVFGQFLVGIAGTEYVLDLKRFDPNLYMRGEFAPDGNRPDKPRDQYLRHHLVGESALWEVIDYWASIQTKEVRQRVESNPDVEEFHMAISQLLLERFQDERKQARLMPDPEKVLPAGRAIVVSLGYRPDSVGYIYESQFHLDPLDVRWNASVTTPGTSGIPYPQAMATDRANETTWWRRYFEQAVDSARADHPPGQALGVAALETVQHVIANQRPEHLVGGRCRAGYVTPEGAVAFARDSQRMEPPRLSSLLTDVQAEPQRESRRRRWRR